MHAPCRREPKRGSIRPDVGPLTPLETSLRMTMTNDMVTQKYGATRFLRLVSPAGLGLRNSFRKMHLARHGVLKTQKQKNNFGDPWCALTPLTHMNINSTLYHSAAPRQRDHTQPHLTKLILGILTNNLLLAHKRSALVRTNKSE